jgi:hypothetical protein
VVNVEASPAVAKHTFDTYSMAADDSAGKPSIGDSAYWDSTTKAEPQIHVLKGKVHYSVGMRPANEKQLQDLAAAIAAGI